MNDLGERSLGYLTLKWAFFRRVTNGTVPGNFGKFFGKDILWRHIWWASPRRAGITNFRALNIMFCAAFNCRNSSKSGVSFFSISSQRWEVLQRMVHINEKERFYANCGILTLLRSFFASMLRAKSTLKIFTTADTLPTGYWQCHTVSTNVPTYHIKQRKRGKY